MNVLVGRRRTEEVFALPAKYCIAAIRTVSITGNHLCAGPLDPPDQASTVVGRSVPYLPFPAIQKTSKSFHDNYLMGISHRCKHKLQLANSYGQLTVCDQV